MVKHQLVVINYNIDFNNDSKIVPLIINIATYIGSSASILYRLVVHALPTYKRVPIKEFNLFRSFVQPMLALVV